MRPTTLAAILLISASALTAAPPAQAQPVNLDKLKSNLDSRLRNNVVGYAFAITWRGRIRRTGSGGLARVPAASRTKMTPSVRQNVASVTKTITTIAVLQLLGRNKLTVAHPIAPWLPKDWPRGYGFGGQGYSLTFKHLLTHTSGLDQRFQSLSQANKNKWGNNWDGLKYVVGLGVRKADVGKRAYKNANFALFRLIIPALWRKAQGAPLTGITKTSAGPIYMFYVADHIFVPSGIKTAACEEFKNGVDAAGYDVTNPTGGKLWNVSAENCGGHGNWHLSARHLAAINAGANCANHPYLAKSRRLLTAPWCFARDTLGLGWNGSSRGRYWHGGDLFSPKTKPRQALHSCVMKFPGNLEIAALMNSDTRNGKSLCTILLEAFDAS